MIFGTGNPLSCCTHGDNVFVHIEGVARVLTWDSAGTRNRTAGKVAGAAIAAPSGGAAPANSIAGSSPRTRSA